MMVVCVWVNTNGAVERKLTCEEDTMRGTQEKKTCEQKAF
jgi:hypothetical protein